MQNYKIVSRLGEGTYSEVMRAIHVPSGRAFAIKCIKKSYKTLEEVNSLAEIRALRKMRGHPHIVQLQEILYANQRLALVLELLEMNLYEAIKDRRSYLSESKILNWMFELLQALEYMHRNGIFHRDVKPENLLLLGDELKLADLGSCGSTETNRPLTEVR